MAVMSKDLESTSTRLATASAELDTIKVELGKLTPQAAKLEASTAARRAKMDKLQAQIDGLADEVFGAFAARLNMSSVREYETQVLARAEASMKARRDLSDALSKLRSKLAYETEREPGKALAEAQARSKAEAAKLKDLEAQLATAQAAVDAAKGERDGRG
jgi:chromosome segregation ATPase